MSCTTATINQPKNSSSTIGLKKNMANLDLAYVDELISARRMLHGGNRGAPPIEGGVRVGTSINRSCIVMLSALLQTYVEEVFSESARHLLPRLQDEAVFRRYWNQMKNWGNPNSTNITHLFLKIGIPGVLEGITWQRTRTEAIVRKLDTINMLRNRIAHGHRELVIDRQNYSLSLAKVESFRNFSHNFGQRFGQHVDELIAQH